MSNFLENLKKSVDEGEFNSDAAKRINSIDEKADSVLNEKSAEQIEESVREKAVSGGVKTVDEEEVARLNSEYEEKMKERAAEEIYLSTIATLYNDDNLIEKAKDELWQFIDKQRQIYSRTEEYADLHTLMDKLVEKYGFEEE